MPESGARTVRGDSYSDADDEHVAEGADAEGLRLQSAAHYKDRNRHQRLQHTRDPSEPRGCHVQGSQPRQSGHGVHDGPPEEREESGGLLTFSIWMKETLRNRYAELPSHRVPE